MSELPDLQEAILFRHPDECERCGGTGYGEPMGIDVGPCLGCDGTGWKPSPDQVLPPTIKDGFP